MTLKFSSRTITLEYCILLIHRRQIYPYMLCDSLYSINVSDLFRKFRPLCLLSSIDQQMMSKDIFLNPLTTTPIWSNLTIFLLRLAPKMWSVSQILIVSTERDYWLLKLFLILEEEVDTLPVPPSLSSWVSALMSTWWTRSNPDAGSKMMPESLSSQRIRWFRSSVTSIPTAKRWSPFWSILIFTDERLNLILRSTSVDPLLWLTEKMKLTHNGTRLAD